MRKFLLDTHTFIWLGLEPVKLSGDCQNLILDSENILILSLVSVWEMQRDPFDRLLIAQAIAENIPIFSDDRLFDLYPIERLW